MSFGLPIALLLLLPLTAAGALIWRHGDVAVAALPGHWRRLVEPRLRAYLGRGIAEGRNPQLALCLAVLTVLVVALSRPALDSAQAPDYGNLTGRVVVLDLSGAANVTDERLFVQRLIEESPEVPTALVAVAADAFDVVPLTTDGSYLLRYLQVVEPELMPRTGRALNLGLAHAQSVLTAAGIVAGQVVLVSGGEPPRNSPIAPTTQALRDIVVPEARMPAWADYATASGARLDGLADVPRIVAELNEAVDALTRTRTKDQRFDLTPWLIGLAMLLWLGLFRRRVAR